MLSPADEAFPGEVFSIISRFRKGEVVEATGGERASNGNRQGPQGPAPDPLSILSIFAPLKVGEDKHDKLGMEESLLKVWEVWEETLVWESPTRRCSEAFQDFGTHKLQPVAISIEGL